ncbi:hypothetical protein A6P39_021005 [Streptomyces sp. FXJ1.172]|uniref:hypothetical protein n=1 Tax=Streptomyces sp. FXJ1.172 TaxID=710705 RepID=UPI0007CFFD6B|nr:hypothetical protein [Streptomyces sp. FXJ1.172]WEO96309.1 hypothetical protein A6P39_021005 [Streptomyces sp. FXJ1.172]
MPPRQPDAVPITLAGDEVFLITNVLRQAAAECSADTTPDARLDDGVTLGRLAAHWAGIVERQPGREAACLDAGGTSLVTVPQNREAWYQVRAALSDHAAQVSRSAELDGLTQHEVLREQAHSALLLADRIAEATHGW